MKIGFFEIEGWEDKLIQDALQEQDIFSNKNKVTDLELPKEKDFDIISIFVDSRINGKVLKELPNLKCIATRSTGYDHIDLGECRKRGIKVLYVPGYGDNTVAEFTFGLLLNLTRNIYRGIDQIKEVGSFSQKGLRGIDIKGKTIGILGTGNIGKEVAKIARGFEMNIVAFDPYPDDEFAKKMGIIYKSFEEVLQEADIITIHCPYNKNTHHLINKSNINQIKNGAYLINTARGGIVETEALVEALDKGILAGVGLDVLEEEGETKDELNFLSTGRAETEELKTMLRNHILMKMPNVLITPHIAFNSIEALERILKITLDNINGFISGGKINEVK